MIKYLENLYFLKHGFLHAYLKFQCSEHYGMNALIFNIYLIFYFCQHKYENKIRTNMDTEETK